MKISKALTDFMKRLRPMIEGKVEKLKSPRSIGWLVDEHVVVEVEYVCLISGEDKVKDCVPHSVKVFVSEPRESWVGKGQLDYERHSGSSYNTRTYKRRQDGTINLEAVSIAIRKAGEAYKDWKKRVEESEDLSRAATESRKDLFAKVVRGIPKRNRLRNQNNHWGSNVTYGKEDRDIEVRVRVGQDKSEGTAYIELNIDQIPADKYKEVVKLVKEAVKLI